MSEIWVLVDTSQGKIRNVTYEVLTAARKLKEKNGATVAAVYIGDSTESRFPSTGCIKNIRWFNS